MLEVISIAQIVEFFGMLAAIGHAIHTVHKVKKDRKEEREAHKAEILQAAYDADTKLRTAIDARIELLYNQRVAQIEALKRDLDNFVNSFDSELSHIKEKQAGEIRNLGEKIEDLRNELRTQHGQLITLVTKLVEKA